MPTRASKFSADKRLLCIDYTAERAEWALPAHPPIVNDIGQLVIGAIEITPNGLRIETNSERRLEHITGSAGQLLGDLGKSDTRAPNRKKHLPFPDAVDGNSLLQV